MDLIGYIPGLCVSHSPLPDKSGLSLVSILLRFACKMQLSFNRGKDLVKGSLGLTWAL